MKRRLISVMLLVLMGVVLLTGFAYGDAKHYLLEKERRTVLIVEDEEAIEEFMKFVPRDSNLLYSFFIPNNLADKYGGVCLMCGTPNLYNGIIQDEHSVRLYPCPGNDYVTDRVSKFLVYNAEMCSSCGYINRKNLIAPKWIAYCHSFSPPRQWTVVPGATPAKGYDVHQCLPTW